MKVVHFTLSNGSGLNRVSTNLCLAEKMLGLDSVISYTDKPEMRIVPEQPEHMAVIPQKEALVADIHVCHSHLPDDCVGKSVFIPHGTPEHCFTGAIEQYHASGYTAGDAFMLSKYRIDHCDATVTFWPRHAYIWGSLNPKAKIHVIPMGVDLDHWKPVPTKGKWSGTPSLFTCENSHAIKWPLDIILAFPIVAKATKAILHTHYIPMDQHRWWFPLMQANGTSYRSYSSGMYFDADTLRNAFASVDYYINPVRYGDFNSVGIEAAASGAKIISYRGNPYAHYWLTEGDQRTMAQEMIDIFEGKTPPREIQKIASVHQMAQEMKKIYESL